MIKLLNIKTNYCNNIKNTTTPKTISFRGIKALKNDTFEPGKNFTVRQCYNFDEFEGFLDFYPSKDPSNILCARYFICDSSNPPSYLKGDKINCQFDISEIDEAKKVDKNEEDYIGVSRDDSTTGVECIGEIKAKKDDDYYTLSIKEFSQDITLVFDSPQDFKVGDKVFVKGSLGVDMEE